MIARQGESESLVFLESVIEVIEHAKCKLMRKASKENFDTSF